MPIAGLAGTKQSLHFNIIFVLLCGSLTALHAQDGSSIILSKCAQAMGSDTAILSLRGEGTVSYPGNSSALGHIVWRSLATDRLRQEITDSQGLTVETVNGATGFRGMLGKRQALPLHTLTYFRSEFNPALACSLVAGNLGMQVQFVGVETLQGHTVNHLLFSIPPKGLNKRADAIDALMSEFHLFIDPANNTVFATRKWIFSDAGVANRSIWESYYSDYRAVGGRLMPFHIENHIAGQKLRELTFSSISPDPSIAISDFQ